MFFLLLTLHSFSCIKMILLIENNAGHMKNENTEVQITQK